MSQQDFSSVCVIGLGYIGLPTATFLASAGLEVTGVDVDGAKVDSINLGRVPFVEPDFDQFFAEVMQNGNFVAQTTVSAADAFVIAVPTPLSELHKVDLTYVQSAVGAIAPVVESGNLIVLESTSPPGTTLKIRGMLEESLAAEGRSVEFLEDVLIAHCPERVLPGNVMKEMTENDRVVGGINPQSSEAARELYSSFCEGTIMLTDSKTAEMVKLVENSFRDVNIAFANELSLICDELDVNVWDLIKMANHHPRVNILSPGPGVGGHCIAVDPWFLVDAAPKQAKLTKKAREVNDAKPKFVLESLDRCIREEENPVVAMWGLTFKPDIDDFRESPALKIVKKALELYPDVNFYVVEPYLEVLLEELSMFENVTLVNAENALNQANISVLMVDHAQFRTIHTDSFAPQRLLDTRGAWTASSFKSPQ